MRRWLHGGPTGVDNLGWDAGAGAGFSTGRAWLPVGEANRVLHVAGQRDDPPPR